MKWINYWKNLLSKETIRILTILNLEPTFSRKLNKWIEKSMFNNHFNYYGEQFSENCNENQFYRRKSRSEECLYVNTTWQHPPQQGPFAYTALQFGNQIPLPPGFWFSNCNMGRYPVPPHQRQNSYYNRSKSLADASKILKVQSKRRWEDLKPQKSSSKPHFDFSLMSYNVLAQKLLEDHEYLYKNHNRSCKRWEIRWPNLFNEIKTLKPDILCLQEVQESHLKTHYKKLEEIGYKGLFKKRTGVRCDGCALYYKADKFMLVEYETVEFFQPGVPVLDRDNIAVIAKFCPKGKPDKPFIVATTHLLYNPKRQDVRLAQTQLLITEIERLSFRWSSKGKERYWPIILTGDFNSTPDSVVYEFISKGLVKYDHLEARKLHKVQSPVHGKVLVPKHLQITDECKHESLVQKRAKKQDLTRLEESALIMIRNTGKTLPPGTFNPAKNSNPDNFCSGTIRHPFAFKSVYQHGTPEDPEGTTFQDKWVTVDYIFYSGKKIGDSIEDHKLVLLSRYRLPLGSELGEVTIPNSLMGSDHLCLVGKFRLKL